MAVCKLLFKEAKKNSFHFLESQDAVDVNGIIQDKQLFDEAINQLEQETIQAYGIPGKHWFENPLADQSIIPNEEVFTLIDEKRKVEGLYEEQLSKNIALEETQVLPPDEQVVYQLRVVNALQSDKIRQPKLNNLQGFYNDLQKQGIPSQQVDLVKDILSDAKESITKEDIIRELLLRYSYSVEINIGMINKEARRIATRENIDYEDAVNYAKTNTQEPTSYYSNLTVPGGTNYREVEIRTPGIVPSITGHAAFATKHGAGWFRASDRVTYTNKEELINLLKNSKLLEIDCS